jgi:hypothetical protein
MDLHMFLFLFMLFHYFIFCATSMQHGNWELKFEGPELGGGDITRVTVSKS